MPANLVVNWLAAPAAVGAIDRIEWGGRAAPGNLMVPNSQGTIRFTARNGGTVCAIWHPATIRALRQGKQPPGFFDGLFPTLDEPLLYNESTTPLVLHFETAVAAFGLEVDFTRGDPGHVFDVTVQVADWPQIDWVDRTFDNVSAASTVFVGAMRPDPGGIGWVYLSVHQRDKAGSPPIKFAVNSIDIAS